MTAYYNEFNPFAAEWLRALIAAGAIPQGDVDERSIEEVRPADLAGYTQCHFFAGIGGWPLALRLAGVPDSQRVWTGSPPCQGFSVAGHQLGFSDQRHLAPQFLALIRQCSPPVIFGEQVSAAIATGWWDFVQAHLEDEGYTCAMAVLPSSSIGAPHKRERLFFGADLPARRVAYPYCERLQRKWPNRDQEGRKGQNVRPAGLRNRTGACYWSDANWVECTDGNQRPTEPGVAPLAHGFSRSVGLLQPELSRMANRNRAGRLKGYGNAINVRLAAQFVTSYLEAMADGPIL